MNVGRGSSSLTKFISTHPKWFGSLLHWAGDDLGSSVRSALRLYTSRKSGRFLFARLMGFFLVDDRYPGVVADISESDCTFGYRITSGQSLFLVKCEYQHEWYIPFNLLCLVQPSLWNINRTLGKIWVPINHFDVFFYWDNMIVHVAHSLVDEKFSSTSLTRHLKTMIGSVVHSNQVIGLV